MRKVVVAAVLVFQIGCTINSSISNLQALNGSDGSSDKTPVQTPSDLPADLNPLFKFDTLSDNFKPKKVVEKFAGDCFIDGQVITYTIGNVSGSVNCLNYRFEIGVNISQLTQKAAKIDIESEWQGRTLEQSFALELQPWLYPPLHSQIIDYATWAGDRLLVWSNTPSPALYVYSMVTDQWSTAATPPIATARVGSTFEWTGTQLIIWGGSDGATTYYNDGAVYTLSTNSWTTMTTVNAPVARMDAGSVWTGTALMIYGGFNIGYRNTGGIYDPVLNQWTSIPVGAVARRWPNLVLVDRKSVV